MTDQTQQPFDVERCVSEEGKRCEWRRHNSDGSREWVEVIYMRPHNKTGHHWVVRPSIVNAYVAYVVHESDLRNISRDEPKGPVGNPDQQPVGDIFCDEPKPTRKDGRGLCEHCDRYLVTDYHCGCPTCGAPQCCQGCCKESYEESIKPDPPAERGEWTIGRNNARVIYDGNGKPMFHEAAIADAHNAEMKALLSETAETIRTIRHIHTLQQADLQKENNRQDVELGRLRIAVQDKERELADKDAEIERLKKDVARLTDCLKRVHATANNTLVATPYYEESTDGN